MTAIDVARTWKFVPTMWASFSPERTRPWSPSRNCHATVRSTNVTKNGSNIKNRYVDLFRPPKNAIQYAIGYASSTQITVATTPYQSDRMSCSWYCEITWE